MLQTGHGLRLDSKSSQVLWCCASPGQDHLQGHESVGTSLTRLVDHAHGSPPKFTEDLVAGDSCKRGSVASWLRAVTLVSHVEPVEILQTSAQLLRYFALAKQPLLWGNDFTASESFLIALKK